MKIYSKKKKKKHAIVVSIMRQQRRIVGEPAGSGLLVSRPGCVVRGLLGYMMRVWLCNHDRKCDNLHMRTGAPGKTLKMPRIFIYRATK